MARSSGYGCAARVVVARFLHGRRVRWVWTLFEREDGQLTQPQLILSTETGLSDEQILVAYAKNWSIDPMFNQLKNGWGMKQSWPQTRQVLGASGIGRVWADAVTGSTGLWRDAPAGRFVPLAGRAASAPRPGAVGTGGILGPVDVRQWRDVKSRKFGPSDAFGPPERLARMRKAA